MSRRARPTTSNRVLQPDSGTLGDGYDVMRAAGRLPQGIQAANDQLALGAMRYIYERGGVVPRDVRVSALTHRRR